MGKPFIYIAALRRTGSTVLSEALSQLPYCFIFREPHLHRNRFVVKSEDDTRLDEYGVNLNWFSRKCAIKAKFGGDTVRAFTRELVPRLLRNVQQVGIKDIHPKIWRRFHEAFPDMKVVLNARDPRDIFLSLHHRLANNKGRWEGELVPQRVADSLNEEFAHQRDIADTCDTITVRYEDLCTDPQQIERVKAFTGCAAPDVQSVGQFNASNRERQDEYELHGNTITDKRVRRFEQEPDAELVAAARSMIQLMPEFCEFWGYADD